MRKVSRMAAAMSAAQPRLAVAVLCLSLSAPGLAAEHALVREMSISLGTVQGRIDHLAVDLVHRRLFVAELGNNSVGVVDLNNSRLQQTLTGFSEPQGIGYSASTDELFVANAGDGSVRTYSGDLLAPSGQIRLGEDADNVRVTTQPAQVIVGYGQGALAIIDVNTKSRLAEVRLRGHPEGFQVLGRSARVLVNVPDHNEIAVIDIRSARQIASWPMDDMHGNFPMAVDEENQTAWVATRAPAKLIAMDAMSGARKTVLESCGDADDVMIDGKRHRIYVICGSGHIDVWDTRAGSYLKIARLETSPGARTALFVPELDRLYLAVRASQGAPAAIWVYRPTP
jgi:DNA-binding beta-propeller fold protein YncE